MNVKLYGYSGNLKKLNKTSMLIDELDLTNVYLKEGTSATHPSILVTTSINIVESGYNYCYISEFSRYYFFEVDSVCNNVWELKCTEDVLQSFHSTIETNQAYIERSESNYNDFLVDESESFINRNRIEFTNLSNQTQGSLATLDLNEDISGTDDDSNIIISVINDLGVQPILSDSTGYTYDATYTPPIPNMSKINHPYHTGGTYYNYSYLGCGWSMDVIKTIYQENVASFIKSIVMLPFSLTPLNATKVKLRLGNSDYGTEKFLLPNFTAFGWMCFFDYTFPLPPNFYDYEPYTNYELYIPYVGWRKIDISEISGKRITMYLKMNYESGKGKIYLINYTDNYIIATYDAQIGVVVPISRSNLESLNAQAVSNSISMVLGVLGGAVSTTLGVASGNPIAIASGIMGATSAVAKGISSNIGMFEQGQAQVRDGFSGLDVRKVWLKKTQRIRLNTNITPQFGKPVNTILYISQCSGFTKGIINKLNGIINATKWEQDEIIRLFSEGIII